MNTTGHIDFLHQPERRYTTMQLLELQTPESSPQLYKLLRERKPAIIVFQASQVGGDKAGLLMGDVADDFIHVLLPPKLTRSGSVYKHDGTANHRQPPMLAWRTWDGFWHVIDSRVSALLPMIDNYIEGDET